MHDCITFPRGGGLAPYQAEILSTLAAHRRITVRAPHGAGKTMTAALAVLWFALTREGRNWKVVTTASAWRQLSDYLWPEIRLWARRLHNIGRAPLDLNRELLKLNINLGTGSAFAVASDNAALIEGAHADHLLYVFDEAKTIPPETWDAAEGAFASGDCYALAISTPGHTSGRFYDIHRRAAGYEDWRTRHITLQEAVEAGRIRPDWVEQRRRQWGEGSAVYRNRVLGEFAEHAEDTIIPLSWIEAANERWHALADADAWEAFTCAGVDVGRGGDQTTLALRHGNAIREIRYDAHADTMYVTGLVAGVLEGNGGYAVVDVIGIGAGVYDRLREQGKSVSPFNAAEGTPLMDSSGELGFVNRRAAAWWGLRERLDPTAPNPVALPPDDRLTGELTAPRWRVMSGGRIQVESKDDVRKRLDRSTDAADAVIMAFASDAGASFGLLALDW